MRVLKDYLEYQGYTNLAGSDDVLRQAHAVNLIGDGEGWMEMIKSREQTTESFNPGTANDLADRITVQYFKLFQNLLTRMTSVQKHLISKGSSD